MRYDVEFDSDKSVKNDGVDDETKLHSYDELQLASPVLLLVGC